MRDVEVRPAGRRPRRLAAALIFVCSPAWAQNITVDGRLSAARTLAGPNYGITSDLGRQAGGNLFHSFGKFGLATGESATFSGPPSVAHVIGRVTGGAASSIDGKIASTIPGASVYLINPAGIVFGPNATTNVSGGFHASTADHVRLSDGALFSASNPDASTLTAAPPAAFGFTSVSPKAITVNGSALSAGGTLGLVGGPVTVNDASLTAPAGTIHIASVAGRGEAAVDPRRAAPVALDAYRQPTAAPAALGPVAISASTIDVSDAAGKRSGGSVFVRGGSVSVSSGSLVNVSNYGSGGSGQAVIFGSSQISFTAGGSALEGLALGRGPSPDLMLSTGPGGAVLLDSGALISGSGGAGAAGAIRIASGSLTLRNKSLILSEVDGTGAAGPIAITLAGDLTIANSQIWSLTTGPANGAAVSLGFGGSATLTGNGATNSRLGNVGAPLYASARGSGGPSGLTITGGALSIQNGNGIQSDAAGGDAGLIALTLSRNLLLSNAAISSSAFGAGAGSGVTLAVGGDIGLTGAFILTDAKASGTGGGIGLTAGSLSIDAASLLGTMTEGSGRAGDVTLSVGGPLNLAGPLGSQSTGALAGDTGRLALAAGTTSLSPGGLVYTTSDGAGAPGAISLAVTGSLSIDGTGMNDTATGIESTALGAPASGAITVAAQTVTVRNALIGGGTNSAQPGAISVTASGDLTIDGTGSAAPNGIQSSPSAGGNSGTIDVSAGRITLLGNGGVSSITSGSAIGGAISVTTAGQLLIDGRGATTSLGGLRTLADANSIGGDIVISAGSVALQAGGRISTGQGSGGSGNIRITTGGSVVVDASAAAASDTSIATAPVSGAGLGGTTGPAGGITIVAGSLGVLSGGSIDASSSGTGTAGGITLRIAGDVTVDTGASGLFADIKSNAFGAGAAGPIHVTAANVDLRGGGQISSSSFEAAGNAGAVALNVPGQILIDGGGSPQAQLSAGIQSRASGTGNAGNIAIDAGSVAITRGGGIGSSTAGTGAGGSIQLSATGAVTIDGTGTTNTTSGIFANTSGTGGAPAGSIGIAAASLTLTATGDIQAATLGAGRAGDISVVTRGAVLIDGQGQTGSATGLINQTRADPTTGRESTGSAGSTTVQAASLTIGAGGVIAGDTNGGGGGGDIKVTVAGALSIDGGGSPSLRTGILARTLAAGGGAGGQIRVSTGSLSITNAGQITAATRGAGAGGSVSVAVVGAATLDGGGSATTGLFANTSAATGGAGGRINLKAAAVSIASAAQIATSTDGSGNAGATTVEATSLTIRTGGVIAGDSSGSGSGGDVAVAVGGPLSIDGGGLTSVRTGIFARTQAADGGRGGQVQVSAATIAIDNAGQVTASTAGVGAGGAIVIASSGDTTLSGAGATVSTSSGGTGDAGGISISAGRLLLTAGAAIAAEARTANGGDISLAVGKLLSLTHSSVTTTVAGATGNGGNIRVDPIYIILRDGHITANAIGGNGGNITIAAGALIEDTASAITASSQLGLSGTVQINGPQPDLSGALAVLASDLRPSNPVLREGCATQGGRPRSHLVASGRGSTHQELDASLPSLYLASRPPLPASTASDGASVADAAAFAAPNDLVRIACR